jgi:hypothetical protein
VGDRFGVGRGFLDGRQEVAAQPRHGASLLRGLRGPACLTRRAWAILKPCPGGTTESLRHPAQSSHEVDIGIIGTGFSGLGAAIRLKRAGIDDFLVFERADDVGGTWRDNHYPGLCCDIPSHVYSFSFELNPRWTRGFAPGWEIRDYLRYTAAKYRVVDHLRFGHEVLEAAWDEDG